MKKKFVVAGTLMLGMAAAVPAVASTPVMFAGVNSGWNATEFEASSSTEAGASPSVSSEETISASGPAFGGSLGVKFPISTGYLGLEANLGDSSAEYESSQSVNGIETEKESITSDLSYGIAGILAFNVNAHSQFYGIAGYQWTDLEVQTATRDTGTGAATNDTYEETLGGFRVGLGVETAMTNALSLRLEWTHTNYSAEKFQTTRADGTRNRELEGSENRIGLGVIGHF